ncbi:MAG: LysM peptidoglycan-binding domain-containing M23 family metallopeptidase [Deltaproteobacteria bacterium]|nr:LysM peptidoglycan-binding domain-containing M23 family metallopeptidase [Deltaproteobacteria bacterium]
MLRDKKTMFILLFLLLFITACATTPKAGGVYHMVKKGETLWEISRTYNCDPGELAEANNLPDSRIEAGSVLFIPDAASAISIKPGTTLSHKTHATTKKEPPKTVQKNRASVSKDVPHKSAPIKKSGKPRFIWPVEGKISSKFGIYKGMRHNGIKIAGKNGMPVLASAGGTVIHSAPIKYYGETIIIKYNSTYSTVYSHLKKRMVSTGGTVKQGDKIGLLGKEEKTGKSYLYFEIRHKNRAKNPLYYLPKKK